MDLRDAHRHRSHMERVSNIILEFGYHGAEKILEKAFYALGFGYWGWSSKAKGQKIGNFPQELQNEKKWMSELSTEEVHVLREYFYVARSLAYRYLRSRTSSKKGKK